MAVRVKFGPWGVCFSGAAALHLADQERVHCPGPHPQPIISNPEPPTSEPPHPITSKPSNHNLKTLKQHPPTESAGPPPKPWPITLNTQPPTLKFEPRLPPAPPNENLHPEPSTLNPNPPPPRMETYPPWRQPRCKWMVSLVNSHTNVNSKRWHLWEIDLRFALSWTPGWTLNPEP